MGSTGSTAVPSAGSTGSTAVPSVGSTVQAVLQYLVRAVQAVLQYLVRAVQAVLQYLVRAVQAVLQYLVWTVQAVLQYLVRTVQAVLQYLVRAVQAVLQYLVWAVQAVLQYLVWTVQAVVCTGSTAVPRNPPLGIFFKTKDRSHATFIRIFNNVRHIFLMQIEIIIGYPILGLLHTPRSHEKRERNENSQPLSSIVILFRKQTCGKEGNARRKIVGKQLKCAFISRMYNNTNNYAQQV